MRKKADTCRFVTALCPVAQTWPVQQDSKWHCICPQENSNRFTSVREHFTVAEQKFITPRVSGTTPREKNGVKWKVLQDRIDGVLWPKLGPFSRTSNGIGYVGRRRAEAPKKSLLETSQDHFGKHFHSILGTFCAHFGGPQSTLAHMPSKGGGQHFGGVDFF